MKNRAIADMFDRIADALELKGEIAFRVNAYRRASRVIQDLSEDIETVWKEGRLKEITGIGEGMAQKIEQFLSTGTMEKYEELTQEVSAELLELLAIQGLGPKTLFLAQKELEIGNLEDLRRAVDDGSLEKLPGMGAKKVDNIRKGIQLFLASKERISLGVALPIAEAIIGRLRDIAGVKRISMAGSLRRHRETVGDIDILCEGEDGEGIIRAFTALPGVERVLASGDTKGSIVVEGGTQVDLRVVEPGSYGSALQYFTGSKEHNVRLREMAKKRGLKISEYGVFKGEKKIGGRDEEDIYRAVGLPLIVPELREDRGEVEAALEGRLPELVSFSDFRGDFHVHSAYSDGSDSIMALAQKAISVGYDFVAICDHSKSASYAGGIDEATLLAQLEEIKSVNADLKGFRVLSGSEVDIKADGSLDFADDVLAKLDVVVASIHSGFKQRVTERILTAMKNPHVDIIGHPTGRLISRREGYEVDLERVMRGAAETGTALEINAYPDRMDLSDVHCRRARELGITLAVGTDAHYLEQLDFMKFGVAVARRGWLERADLLNTFTAAELKARLSRKAGR